MAEKVITPESMRDIQLALRGEDTQTGITALICEYLRNKAEHTATSMMNEKCIDITVSGLRRDLSSRRHLSDCDESIVKQLGRGRSYTNKDRLRPDGFLDRVKLALEILQKAEWRVKLYRAKDKANRNQWRIWLAWHDDAQEPASI